MYGMVNKAVEDMVCTRHGEAMWEQVKARADVNVEVFISNESYPDEMTYKLVGAASAMSGRPPQEVLEAFGEHWILKTANEGYGGLMAAGGKSLPEFLNNLPDFHARVSWFSPSCSRPGSRSPTPPTGRCTSITSHIERAWLTLWSGC